MPNAMYVCTSRIRAGIQTHDTRESDLPLNYQGSLAASTTELSGQLSRLGSNFIARAGP